MSRDRQNTATLWEMFRQWLRRGRKDEPEINLPDHCRNLLDWPPGLPVDDPDIIAAFPGSLVMLSAIRHSVRRVMGQDHHFADYILRITPRQNGAEPSVARLRVAAGGPRLLLRLHDEFGFAEEFVAVVNDDTGIFQVDDDPSGEPARFERLNGVHGAWTTGVYEQGDEDKDGKFDDTGLPFHEMEFWDFIRACADGTEEFLFVEIHQGTGWTQIWRGRAVSAMPPPLPSLA